MKTKTKVISLASLLTGSVVFGMILAGSLDFTKWASAEKPAPAAAEVFRINLREIQAGDLSQNIRLQPNDTVFVPQAATVPSLFSATV